MHTTTRLWMPVRLEEQLLLQLRVLAAKGGRVA